MTNHVNYGPIFRPEGEQVVELPIKASVAFKAKGGKFVSKDGTDDYKLAVAADGASTAGVIGWCDVQGDFTTPAAITNFPVITDTNAIFEMPIGGGAMTEAQCIAAMFKKSSIVDTNVAGTSVQSVRNATAGTGELIIVGYDVEAQTLYVKLNPAQHVLTGV
jgi:hypothetical protein